MFNIGDRVRLDNETVRSHYDTIKAKYTDDVIHLATIVDIRDKLYCVKIDDCPCDGTHYTTQNRIKCCDGWHESRMVLIRRNVERSKNAEMLKKWFNS